MYPIYAHDRLSVAVALRVAEANAEYESTLEDVVQELGDVDEEVRKLDDTGDERQKYHKFSAWVATRLALETRLYEPRRALIEAFADMGATSCCTVAIDSATDRAATSG